MAKPEPVADLARQRLQLFRGGARRGDAVRARRARSPAFNVLLNEGLACDTRLVAQVLVGDGHGGHIFSGLTSLVDVGGGTGGMAAVVAEAFPQVKCVVLELPHVVDSLLQQEMTSTRMVEVVAGDMFEFIPHADAVLLKWVLHDWSDDRGLCENTTKVQRGNSFQNARWKSDTY